MGLIVNAKSETTLSYASVMGFKSDLKLEGDSYQWLGSIFYFGSRHIPTKSASSLTGFPGYLAWEYPSSRMLQRFPLAKYSSVNIILWGTTLACFASVRSYEGAAVLRFFLGAFEAAVTPGFALFTSQWYTKNEQGARTGIWFSFNGVAAIVGGVLAYGISRGSRQYGSAIEPWRILFLTTGLSTILTGFTFLYHMPDNQWNSRFLRFTDRKLAVERIRGNQQGIGNKMFKRYQVREALKDPMTWAFAFYACAGNIPNGGITSFFSQLIVLSGYTAEESLLYGAPAGAVQVISLVGSGILGDLYGQRILVSCLGLGVGILGAILLAALPLSNSIGRLAGYYLTQASPTPFVALLSLISTNIAGHTKKTTVAAIYMIAYCLGNIIGQYSCFLSQSNYRSSCQHVYTGPHTFRPQDAPRYIPAQIAICCCWGACFIDLILIWVYYRRENTIKAAIRHHVDYEKLPMSEFLDLTDKENPELIYTV